MLDDKSVADNMDEHNKCVFAHAPYNRLIMIMAWYSIHNIVLITIYLKKVIVEAYNYKGVHSMMLKT